MRVYDSNLNQQFVIPHGDQGILNDPTGLCVPGKDIGYNPLNFEKDDDVSTCVEPRDLFTYTMPYSNGNPQQVTGVTIVDTLPSEVTYESHTTSRGTCTLSPSGDTLTCDIGTLLSGDSGSVTLTVSVNAGTPAGTTITNSAVINGNEANTGPTTKDVETDVCQPGEKGNCCACPANSNPGDPCVCMQAASQTYCVNNLNGTWVGPNGCTLGETTGCEGLYCQDGQCIPEFSTIAIPVASILGLLFYFNYRKRKREQ